MTNAEGYICLSKYSLTDGKCAKAASRNKRGIPVAVPHTHTHTCLLFRADPVYKQLRIY